MEWFKRFGLRAKLLLLEQIKLGTTPHKLAQTVGFGMVLGIIPVLGVTTGLCALFALRLRLNQVIIQAVNYVAYPFQLLLFIPFYRAGEWLFNQPPIPLYIPDLIEQFQMNFWGSMEKYTMAGLMGVCAWLLISPLLYFGLYSVTNLVVKKIKV
jgi:uncharacterized protein (DUF2062 family)